MDFTKWQSSRYIADAKSRNQPVLREFIERIDDIQNVKIIDLGAGIGSNFRYLVERINTNQIWYFIDLDPEFLKIAPKYLSEKLHLKVEYGKVLQRDNKSIKILAIDRNFLDIDLNELRVDCLVANAVFDQITKTEFESFVRNHDIPLLYFTNNYNGMEFEPCEEHDQYYIDLYNKEIQQVHTVGKVMGANSSMTMLDILNDNQYDTVYGESNWILTYKDVDLQLNILKSMEETIPEQLSDSDLAAFWIWIAKIRYKILSAEIEIHVLHGDILAFES